jgi:hypothetical protein
MPKMTAPTTYTLYKRIDFTDDQVIARGLTAVDAMSHIVECVDGRHFQTFVENYGHFRRFDLAIINGNRGELPTLHATVSASVDYDADRNAALELIAAQFIRIAHEYWGNWVEPDEDFNNKLQYSADREGADRMEREIAAQFVDVLAGEGYTMARDTVCNDFALIRPADRGNFLEHVFENLVGELIVYKRGAAHRFRFGFGGDGWDIIKDRSGVLGPLIESVVGPYRSKGHPAKVRSTVSVDAIVSKKSEDSMAVFDFMPTNFV